MTDAQCQAIMAAIIWAGDQLIGNWNDIERRRETDEFAPREEYSFLSFEAVAELAEHMFHEVQSRTGSSR